MHLVAFLSYVFAALLGLTLAWLHFRGTPPPRTLAFGHGFLVAVGFVFLVVALTLGDPGEDAGQGWGLAALFAAGASAGIYLSSRHLKKEAVPRWLIVAHGGLNLVTLALLGVWVFAQAPT